MTRTMTDRQDAAAEFIRSEQDTAHHAAKITDQLVDRWRDERTRYETGEQENPPTWPTAKEVT
jgi:hypothetical protein